jgi:hypothetical protein
MNITKYKYALAKYSTSILAQCFAFGLALGFLLSFIFTSSPKPKSEICKIEIAQNKELTFQLSNLRKDFASKKQKILLRCKQDSRNQALKKIEAYKKVCETLRCQICKGAKSE